MKRTEIWAGVLSAALILLTSSSQAGESRVVGGKSNLVCASSYVMACVDGSQCAEGQAHTFNLPAFMFIEPGSKVLRASDQGKEVKSPIKSYEVTEDVVILQGFENHRGWTLAIDRKDGSMTLSATGPDVNFMVAGHCTEY
jgi:hypothetical protein